MKAFDSWARELAENLSEPSPSQDIPEELEGYEDHKAEGGYSYPCRCCDELHEIICDPSEFNADYHYCGKSPRCMP